MDVAAGLPANLTVPLKGLAVRAERVAAKAQPAKGLTLSLCMIVKDEEEMLPRSLAAVKDAVDEMIVVDTGSTDRTVEIAESFGAKVLHHEWTGDFSAARNVSFDAATSDWIVYLDADEVLIAEDRDRLRELTGRVWREAFYLVETNYTGDLARRRGADPQRAARLPQPPRVPLRGPPARADRAHAADVQPGAARVARPSASSTSATWPRSATRRRSRAATSSCSRSRLARAAAGPFLHFNLGSEYAAAGDNAERARASSSKLVGAAQAGRHRAATASCPSLAGRLTKAYRVNGDFAGARRQADEGLELFPGFTDLVFEKGHSYAQEGRLRRGRRASSSSCLELGDAPEQVLRHRRLRHVHGAGRPGRGAPPPGPPRRGGRRCCAAA